MNTEITSIGSAGYALSQEQRNRVLRNTYWLLALSLLPTVLGAWLGVATGITASLRGGLGLIVFLGLSRSGPLGPGGSSWWWLRPRAPVVPATSAGGSGRSR